MAVPVDQSEGSVCVRRNQKRAPWVYGEAFSEVENAFLDCGHYKTWPQISDGV